jgi:hypothetical protein
VGGGAFWVRALGLEFDECSSVVAAEGEANTLFFKGLAFSNRLFTL